MRSGGKPLEMVSGCIVSFRVTAVLKLFAHSCFPSSLCHWLTGHQQLKCACEKRASRGGAAGGAEIKLGQGSQHQQCRVQSQPKVTSVLAFGPQGNCMRAGRMLRMCKRYAYWRAR